MSHCIVQYDEVTSYLIGGYSKSANATYNHLYVYDWNANTWTKKASMVSPRRGKQIKLNSSEWASFEEVLVN